MHANQETLALLPRVVSKPVGGFHPITVLQVTMAWWAYRTGFLPRYLDFRVYLALHEVAERRLADARNRKRKINPRLIVVPPRSELLLEIRSLVGSTSDRLVRGALFRLESTGLVTLAGRFLGFATTPAALRNAPKSLLTVLGGVTSERRLPVPRAMLCMMARSATPALAATVFGCLLKCVWWRRSELHVEGFCTAAFVSKRFGVDERSVKRARAELRRVGWLVSVMGRNGEGHEHPNLTWRRERVNGSNEGELGTVLSPPPVKQDTKMSSHTTCTQLRSGSKDQQLTKQRGTGIRVGREPSQAPRLSNIQACDLRSVERIQVLFEEAVARRLLKGTPAGRLRFFAAAARAARLGSRNPCGFFAAIVRHGLWHVISQADEDRAIEYLRASETDALAPRPTTPSHSAMPDAMPRTDASGRPADFEALVLSLAARCSMDKGSEFVGNVNMTSRPLEGLRRGTLSTVAHPHGRRAERAWRRPIGCDVGPACGRAP